MSLIDDVAAVARVPMSTKAPCGHDSVVKQTNYTGSCLGDDWYFRLLWCPSCRKHHKLYK